MLPKERVIERDQMQKTNQRQRTTSGAPAGHSTIERERGSEEIVEHLWNSVFMQAFPADSDASPSDWLQFGGTPLHLTNQAQLQLHNIMHNFYVYISVNENNLRLYIIPEQGNEVAKVLHPEKFSELGFFLLLRQLPESDVFPVLPAGRRCGPRNPRDLHAACSVWGSVVCRSRMPFYRRFAAKLSIFLLDDDNATTSLVSK